MNTPSQESSLIANPESDKINALDELFLQTLTYRSSKAYYEVMQFIARFPKYAPYNCLLLHMQNPNVTYVATINQWWAEFERRVKVHSRPLVILVPFGPVSFVYDLVDTEGKHLPRQLEEPFEIFGDHVSRGVWERTISNCLDRDRIEIVSKEFSRFKAGDAGNLHVDRGDQAAPKPKCVVRLNNFHTQDQKYCTLAHELAHIYCGHCGGDVDGWWPDRSNIGGTEAEFEAESVAFLVCRRRRLHTTSAEYLACYLSEHQTIPNISFEMVLKVSGYIESLGEKTLEPRKPKAKTAAV